MPLLPNNRENNTNITNWEAKKTKLMAIAKIAGAHHKLNITESYKYLGTLIGVAMDSSPMIPVIRDACIKTRD